MKVEFKRGDTRIDEYPIMITCHKCKEELFFKEVETDRAIEFHVKPHRCKSGSNVSIDRLKKVSARRGVEGLIK